MLVERMRFGQERSRVLGRVATAEQHLHAHLMEAGAGDRPVRP